MLYSQLTPAQVSQVASMFYDAIFNTDPERFDYEISRGQVTGRRWLGGRLAQTKRAKPNAVIAVIEIVPTPEQSLRRSLVIKEIARQVALTQMMEFEPCQSQPLSMSL